MLPEDDGHVVLDANDQSGVALVSASDYLDMVADFEKLAQLGRRKLERLRQILVFGHHRDLYYYVNAGSF